MFLTSKKGSDRFWVQENGDAVAADLAAGTTNRYWLIKQSKKGAVTLKPVSVKPASTIKIKRVAIVADGNVVGSADFRK